MSVRSHPSVLCGLLDLLQKESPERLNSRSASRNNVATFQVELTTSMETGQPVPQSPVLERKNKMSVISRLFKPWRWNLNRKKPSEKIQKQATCMLLQL